MSGSTVTLLSLSKKRYKDGNHYPGKIKPNQKIFKYPSYNFLNLNIEKNDWNLKLIISMRAKGRRGTHSKPVVWKLELKAEKKIFLGNGDFGLNLDE